MDRARRRPLSPGLAATLRPLACLALTAAAARSQTALLFPAPVLRADYGPSAVIAADFNGDGHLDLATPSSGFDPGLASVTLGHGDGTFASTSSVPLLNSDDP